MIFWILYLIGSLWFSLSISKTKKCLDYENPVAFFFLQISVFSLIGLFLLLLGVPLLDFRSGEFVKDTDLDKALIGLAIFCIFFFLIFLFMLSWFKLCKNNSKSNTER